ncbi:MAG: MBL fold metallo-hydrolase [Anaerovoracaceae bacterium]|jgi:glyoxylase-like metal-dependent hydrolase (beta-lactamase superfamily II)
MQEVYKNIYLKELALPNNPLRSLNFYIVKGEDRSMIIDTGFNLEETKQEILDVFRELDLKPENTILFLTHLHSDHTGLAAYFQDMGLEIYMSEKDGTLMNNSVAQDNPRWEHIVEFGRLQGLHVDQLEIGDHPGFKFRPSAPIQFTNAVPGEFLSVGEYNFEIVDLKGHTPGIVGLYERDHKILFCGDHILGKITPNITFWGFEYGDILGTYLESLARTYDMDIDHLFSSHRFLVEDHRKRIEELYAHHEHRLDEARDILKRADRTTVRDVARQLQWDIRSRGWDDFPASQKWFAVGEAHSHLEHLRAIGDAEMEEEDGILYYKSV